MCLRLQRRHEVEPLQSHLHGGGVSAAKALLAPAAKQQPALPTEQPANGHGCVVQVKATSVAQGHGARSLPTSSWAAEMSSGADGPEKFTN